MKTQNVVVAKARTSNELENLKIERREQEEALRRTNEKIELLEKEGAIDKSKKKIFPLIKSIMKNMDEQPEELKNVVSESCSNYAANLEKLRHNLVVDCLTAYQKQFQEKKSPEDFLKYLGNVCRKKSTAVSAKPSSSVLADPTNKEGEDK
jgi:uncharacterized protein YpuA (DUF1002 family)